MGVFERVVPRRIRGSYLGKFGIVLGAILLVVGATSLVFYVGLSATVQEDARTQLSGNAEDEAAELSEWIETNERNARLLSQLGVMEDGSETEIRAALLDQDDALPDTVESIHYVDLEENRIQYSLDPTARGTEFADLDVEVHIRDHEGIEEVPLSQVGPYDVDATYSDTFEWRDRQLMAFLAPVGGTDNAIMITVDMADVGSPFYDPIEGGYTEVVDMEDGDIMMTEDGDRLLEQYGDGTDDEVLRTASVEAQTLDRDGDLLAYASPAETDWVLVSHSPESEAYAVADTVENALIVLIGIVLIGFVLTGATIGRSTARALESLADDADELAEGNLEVEITDSGRIDEVGQVEDCFRATQAYLRTVADQAEALADGEFDSAVLDQDVPGELGRSLATMRADLKAYVDEVEASQAEAREAREEAESLADELEAKAQAFGETVSYAADGDLTRRLDADVDNEAMRTIAQSFNEMLDGLEPMIVDLQALSEEVDEASIDVSAGAEEIDEASDGVAASAEEISAATAEQTDRFAAVQEEMNQLSATIEEVASTSDEVATAAQRAAENTDDVADQSAAIIEEMNELEANAREIVTEIDGLGDEIDRIDTVVDVIDDIAEQTGILALNASIEAARADTGTGTGDGDGFAVIADEVKSLADETAESTGEIETLIEEIRASAEEVIEDARGMQRQVESSTDRVQSGLAAIEEVSDSVDDVNERVQTVSDATDDQAAAAQEVVTMVDEATESSERTNDEAESVAVAVEEQSASTTQVSQTAGELSDAAERLRDALDAFEVRESAAEHSRDDDPVGGGADDAGGVSPTGVEPSDSGTTATGGDSMATTDRGEDDVPAIESGSAETESDLEAREEASDLEADEAVPNPEADGGAESGS